LTNGRNCIRLIKNEINLWRKDYLSLDDPLPSCKKEIKYSAEYDLGICPAFHDGGGG